MVRWKPKQGEKYYFVDSLFCDSNYHYWDDDSFDIDSYSMGNVFKTEEDTEKALEKIKKN